jgi:hypothetical protein
MKLSDIQKSMEVMQYMDRGRLRTSVTIVKDGQAKGRIV